MPPDSEVLTSIQRVEALIQGLERTANPALRSQVQEIVRGLLDFHGAALSRMVTLVVGSSAPELLDHFAHDELVGSVLMLHDLHPEALSERIEKALVEVRPLLKSHGGDVELLSTSDGIVRLKLHGNCHGCPSSALTMQSTIEQAIMAAAPDIAGLEVEGLEPQRDVVPSGFVPLSELSIAPGLHPEFATAKGMA
jgi:Fe-S cluster biogenesis protein NfuA